MDDRLPVVIIIGLKLLGWQRGRQRANRVHQPTLSENLTNNCATIVWSRWLTRPTAHPTSCWGSSLTENSSQSTALSPVILWTQCSRCARKTWKKNVVSVVARAQSALTLHGYNVAPQLAEPRSEPKPQSTQRTGGHNLRILSEQNSPGLGHGPCVTGRC